MNQHAVTSTTMTTTPEKILRIEDLRLFRLSRGIFDNCVTAGCCEWFKQASWTSAAEWKRSSFFFAINLRMIWHSHSGISGFNS